jgi:hypothetical protein
MKLSDICIETFLLFATYEDDSDDESDRDSDDESKGCFSSGTDRAVVVIKKDKTVVADRCEAVAMSMNRSKLQTGTAEKNH